MTPRPVIFSLPADTPVGAHIEASEEHAFSRIPLYEDGPDDITGYVLKTDLLVAFANGQKHVLVNQFRRDFIAVPEFLSVLEIFGTMLEESEHIVLVVNEYGTVQGIVTQEDVIETLIGHEITDETDTVTDMQILAHQRWRSIKRASEKDPEKD